MTREQLVEMARRGIEHWKNGTVPLEADVYRVPTSLYYDPERYQLEMQRIFKRIPLMLGFSAELREPGSYRAIEVVDTPVLLTRGDDGAVHAFVNECSHRGAMVAEEGNGRARRFTCPYHAWVYNTHGELVGLRDAEAFGDIDRTCMGLTQLPVSERAGLIWVVLTPGATVDFDAHLCGYDEVLANLGLGECHLVGRQRIDGPNWKIAYDGYLDYYHLPILHRDTFGPGMSTQAIYDDWGPHQRVTAPDRHHGVLAETPEDEWKVTDLNRGVWTIFPHVSIAAFDAGGKIFMISQLFPGPTVDTSFTLQNFLHVLPPEEQQPTLIAEMIEFQGHVVRDEDYHLGLRTQRAIRSGAKKEFVFGRNEGGGHRFHRWVDALVAADDDQLSEVYAMRTSR
jgi:carnitine monooxygenase subunit